MFVVASMRGNPGRAVADTALLVMLVGIIVLVDIVLSHFMDTGNAASIVAVAFAAASRSMRSTA